MSGILLLLLGGIAVWIGVKGSEGAIWADLTKQTVAPGSLLVSKTTKDPKVPATPAGRAAAAASAAGASAPI
jgi:hypothetical protein